jgi:putative ABC transport system permease protein
MLKSHLKLAVKVLRRRPFFTAVSLLGVGLTLLVLTVATALFDHAFAPQSPEVRQDRTLLLFYLELKGEDARFRGWPGYRFLDRYARDLPGVERMSIASLPQGALSYREGDRVRSYLKRTDGEFWRILSFDFVEGGPFTDDDVAEARFVAVINESTRDRFFGGGPAVGRTIELDEERYQVVGVVRDVPILRLVPFADVWVPLTAQRTDAWRDEIRGQMFGILLARSAADFPAIRAEMRARLPTVDLSGTGFQAADAMPETAFQTFARILLARSPGDEGAAFQLFVLLLGLALAFMVLPALNLVNLGVSRALERASEIGVRRAFGASALQLVGQLVLENVVLALVGGLLALLVAEAVLRAVTAGGLIPYADLHVNLRVFLWGVGFAVVFGMLSGAWPAWRLARLHPVEALRGGMR